MSGSTADNAGRQSGVVAAAAAGIEILSYDPSAEHGKLWFNSTTSLLKIYNNVGAWSAGGTNTNGRLYCGAFGVLTAGASCGGGSSMNMTEEYDGTNWTAVNNMNTGRGELGCAGSQTAAVGFGGNTGSVVTETEEYDGTNWTDVAGDLAGQRKQIGMGCPQIGRAHV